MRAIGWASAVLGSAAIAALFANEPGLLRTTTGLIMLALLACVWVSLLASRLSNRVRIVLLAGAFYGVAALGFFNRGPLPGAALVLLLSVLLLALFIGIRAAAWGAVAVLALYLVSAAGWQTGIFPMGDMAHPPDLRHWGTWWTWILGQLLATGAAVAVVCYILHDLRRTIGRVTESERKFAGLFDASPDGIAISEIASGTLFEVNPAFEKMFGHSRAHAIGRTSVELGLWIDPKEREAMLRELDEHGLIRARELQTRNARGDPLTVLYSAEPIDFGGRRCLIVCSCDITERKRVEAEKARLVEQLRQMQKLDALGTLAGGIAHDFNNVLTAIIGAAELARMDIATDHVAQVNLQSILLASRRARDLVSQILTFSRRTEQRRQFDKLAPIVAETARFVRATAPANVEIRTELPAEASTVLCDPSQIHQVLLNLCTNAVHAMKPGGGMLTLREASVQVDADLAATHPHLKVGPYVRLTVQDTGCGMDHGTLAHLFEPFFTTRGPGEGTGLGLAVVHGIVESHEGAITVYSRRGEGSVFHVFLPVATGPDDQLREIPEAEIHRGQGETILVVDDEAIIVEMLGKMLTRLGYVVETPSDPGRALETFRADPARFSLVLCDFSMPRSSGLHLAREILAVAPGTLFVLMSGFMSEQEVVQARAAGVRHILEKPLDLRALSSAVSMCLHPSDAGADSVAPV
jgi:PAS domain S-box-containing protein